MLSLLTTVNIDLCRYYITSTIVNVDLYRYYIISTTVNTGSHGGHADCPSLIPCCPSLELLTAPLMFYSTVFNPPLRTHTEFYAERYALLCLLIVIQVVWLFHRLLSHVQSNVHCALLVCGNGQIRNGQIQKCSAMMSEPVSGGP